MMKEYYSVPQTNILVIRFDHLVCDSFNGQNSIETFNEEDVTW